MGKMKDFLLGVAEELGSTPDDSKVLVEAQRRLDTLVDGSQSREG